MDNKFRSAVFGGFNRQDVMDYLERTVKEHNQKLDEVNAQLTASREEAEQARAKLARAEEQVSRLEGELAQCVQDRQAREEATALRERLDLLEPDAVAYAAIKERTASIELEAHRRAQTIVDQAQEQAEQVRRELGQWLERVERDYYDLRAQVGVTVTQASSELERVRQGLDNISLCMTNQHSALERLMQTAKNDPSVTKE